MNCELNIRSSSLDANLPDDFDRGIAHGLILAIGERLRGSNRDGIASVHAHGVKIFNRADDDDVVGQIAYDLEFEFFPSQHRFLNEDFVHRREIKTARNNFEQLLAVISNAAARATQSE